jgi:hypothetical protein
MEKDVGLSFDATMTVAEAKNKMHIPFVNKENIGGKEQVIVIEANGFFKQIFKKVFKNRDDH